MWNGRWFSPQAYPSHRDAGTIMSMVWAVLLWVVTAAVLIVGVLWLARGESRDDSYDNADGGVPERRHEERTPRIAGITPAFKPSEGIRRGRRTGTLPDDTQSTGENPVYVNTSSVVEVRGLFKPDDEVTPTPRHGR